MKTELHEQLMTELNKNLPFDPSLQQYLDYLGSLNIEQTDVFSDPLLRDCWFELVTKRNQLLITKEEQQKLRETTVAFFGLSVGSHAALTWMMSSRADTIKIIDPDTIDFTNLNRLRFGFDTVGEKKTEVVSRELKKINPLSTIIPYNVIGKDIYTSILTEVPKVTVIVEETDDLEGKILLRLLAKEYRIPVVSATDVGDTVLLDVERFDTDRNIEPFLGRIPGLLTMQPSTLSPKERMKLVLNVVGLEHCSIKMLDSLLAIGKTVSTWPQLGSTATMAGGLITTAMKKIVLGEPLKSGRYSLNVDALFEEQNEKIEQEKREKIAELYRRLE